MRRYLIVAFTLLLALTANAQTSATSSNMMIVPRDVDTNQFGAGFQSNLVEALWEDAIGCPTNARTFLFNPVTGGGTASTYTDPACATGERSGDRSNFGFLMSKVGPTANLAAAVGEVINESGKFLTELGYDIRKGSHCGAGAPRFNVTLQDGQFFFIGCNSPPPTATTPGEGWDRRRWGNKADGVPVPAFDKNGVLTTIPTNVRLRSIIVVFDEGQDVGPDFTGHAFLDNIDISGVLIGKPIR